MSPGIPWFLAFMGVTYWLVPLLRGRALWSRRTALAQVWLWFVGMSIFSNALHRLGTMGMPRRTMIGSAPYLQPEWQSLLPWVGVGGTLLFLSAILYFVNIVGTVAVSKEPAAVNVEFADAVSGSEDCPAVLDRWWPWVTGTVVLIVIAYVPTLIRLVATTPFGQQGMRVW